jgi:hypothetical protein
VRLARIAHAADSPRISHSHPLGPGLLAIGEGRRVVGINDRQRWSGSFVYRAPAALEAWCQTHPADPAHPRLFHITRRSASAVRELSSFAFSPVPPPFSQACLGSTQAPVLAQHAPGRHDARIRPRPTKRPQLRRLSLMARPPTTTMRIGPRRHEQLAHRPRLAVSQVTGSETRMGEKVRTLSSCHLRRS